MHLNMGMFPKDKRIGLEFIFAQSLRNALRIGLHGNHKTMGT